MRRDRSAVILWAVATAAALLAAAGLLGLDEVIARRSAHPQAGEALLGRVVELLDLVALKEISNFLLGTLLLLAAAALLALGRTRRAGWLLLYLGAVQFLATVVADLSKPPFGRLRPHEAMADGRLVDQWFAGANSFPSGHAAFYAGLLLPLVVLVPRLAWLWLPAAVLVALSRVVEHDHYLSDVAASVALAALLALAFRFLARRGERPA